MNNVKVRTKKSIHCVPLTLSLLEERRIPSISGTVFQDFNADGRFDTNQIVDNAGVGTTPIAVDRGLAGVTVTVFDTNNAAVAQAVSDALGNYLLNVVSTGPYRVEFTRLPQGVFFGPRGTSSGSAIQFVNGNEVSGVNLAAVRPEDFSSNNPTLVTSSYVVGGIEDYDLNSGSGVILSFPYSSGSSDLDPNRTNHQNPTTHALSVAQREVGTTWGLTYDANYNRLFAAAFMKRTSSFGPNGPGAIYTFGTSGSTAYLYADLNSVFPDLPAGNLAALYTDSSGNAVPFRQNYDEANDWFYDGLVRFTDQDGVVRDLGWDAVGKIALGGLDVSADGSHMFTLALGDRRLYSLPTSGPLTQTTIQRFNLPVPASVTGVTALNPLGDLRPFAVEVHRGIVYIGAENSAESTQNSADLRAYVFAFDPVIATFINIGRRSTQTEAVFEFALNYDRGALHIGMDPDAGSPNGITPADPAEWNAWSPVTRLLQVQPESLGRSGYPQPMLTGLSFDIDGNLVLGIRDRSGDQFDRNVPIYPDELNNFSYFSVSAGDTLRAFINSPGNLDAVQNTAGPSFAGWTLESNARGSLGQGAGPQNTGQGPGGGEFYFDDEFPHDPSQLPVGYVGPENDEVSVGGALQVPGFSQTLTTAFDPLRIPGAVNGGGVRWFDNATGMVTKTYELYVTPPASNTATFAKGNGIGDLVAITAPPPIEIGNYVWLDTDRNGIQDADETALANVRLELLDSGGTVVAAALTDANGNYIFSSGQNTSSTSRIYGLALTPNTTYQIRVDGSQATLSGLAFTATNTDASANGSARDSNVNASGSATIVTPPRGAADHSFDIGIVTVPIVVPPPPPIVVPPPPPASIVAPPPPAPPIQLPASMSGYVFRDDCPVDGIREPSRSESAFARVRITLNGETAQGRVIRTTLTNNIGFYSFDNLMPGTYTITESQPLGFYDGLDTPGNLGGSSPANDSLRVELVSGSAGIEYNFAEIAPNAVYGYVYGDANQKRRFDSADFGIRGVVVTISGTAHAGTAMARPLTAAETLGGLTTQTDSNGRWEFPLLPPGSYIISESQPGEFQDFFESAQGPPAQPITLGNDYFSSIGLCNGETRGQLNFGELPTSSPQSPTKRLFLGSTEDPANSLAPSSTPGVNTLPVEVPLNPAFSVRTEVPTFVVVSGGAGRSPLLRVFDYSAGVERLRFYAYEQSYEGGVRVATGDVDGDGIPDIVAATGRGVDPAFEFSAERTAPFFGNFSLMNQPFEAGFSLQWPM